MPETDNPYQSLHDRLIQEHSALEKLLHAKSEALEAVQQSKFPATQLPRIMEALQSQHEWELRMTGALEQIIHVVGVAVEEVDEVNNGAEA